MDMAFFGAGPGARLTADAVLRMGHGHDLVAHIVTEFVISRERFFDQFEHLVAADFEAPSAADALFHVDRVDEFRRPRLPAAGGSGYRGHDESPGNGRMRTFQVMRLSIKKSAAKVL
jgi:hypothetical protein